MNSKYRYLIFWVLFIIVFLFNYVISVYLPTQTLEEGRASLIAEYSVDGKDVFLFRTPQLNLRYKYTSVYEDLKRMTSSYNSAWGFDATEDNGLIHIVAPGEYSLTKSDVPVTFYSFNEYGIVTHYDNICNYDKRMADKYIGSFCSTFEKSNYRYNFVQNYYESLPEDVFETLYKMFYRYIDLEISWGGSAYDGYANSMGIPPFWIPILYDFKDAVATPLLFIEFVFVAFSISNLLYLLFCYLFSFKKKKESLKSYILSSPMCKFECIFVPISLLVVFISVYFRYPVFYNLVYGFVRIIDILSIDYYWG